MRVLICGGRDVGRAINPASNSTEAAKDAVLAASAARKFVFETLDALHQKHKFTLVLCGCEGGAERLGSHWADLNRIDTEVYQRARTRFSRETGEELNARMLAEGRPELIVSFGGGERTGQLLTLASKAGVAIASHQIPPAAKEPSA